MEIIKIKYNSDTILDDVKKVIKYPCDIFIRNLTEENKNYITWSPGSWKYCSEQYLIPALHLDDELFQHNYKNNEYEVNIEIYSLEEYIKIVKNNGIMMNPDFDNSFGAENTCEKWIPASDEYITEEFNRCRKEKTKRKLLVVAGTPKEKLNKVLADINLNEDDVEIVEVDDSNLKGLKPWDNQPYVITKNTLAQIPEPIISEHNGYETGLTKAEKNAVVIPVRTSPKIDRNSKCPCGSGKKYKQCCINK